MNRYYHSMIDVLLSLIYIDQLTEVTQLKQDKFDR